LSKVDSMSLDKKTWDNNNNTRVAKTNNICDFIVLNTLSPGFTKN
jgi:hypothetical protein